MSLTLPMLNCLKAIDRLTLDGVSPSYDELAGALGKASKSYPYRQVRILGKRGYLTYRSAARSIDITPKGRALLSGAQDLSGLSNAALKQLARDVQAEIRRRMARVAA